MSIVPAPSSSNVVVVHQKKKRNTKPRINPSVTALVYRGPTKLPRSAVENDVMTTQLNIINAVASNGSGVINTVFDDINQVQAATDWSSLAALYNEFRVLSMEVNLIPWNPFNQGLAPTINAAPLYTVTDRNSNTAIGSLATVSAYDSAKAHVPGTKVRRVIKMAGSDDAVWTETGGTPGATNRMYIKLYSSGNANSTTYYDYFNCYMVQFRGRK